MLRRMMCDPDAVRAANADLWREMERFSWTVVGPKFREMLTATVRTEPR
jgi:hypothetical protein